MEVSEYTRDVSNVDIEYLSLTEENPIQSLTVEGITTIDFLPPSSVLLSLDNLLRLKLVDEGLMSDLETPQPVKASAAYQKSKEKLNQYLSSPFFKYQEFCRYLALSTLGKSFHAICISSI